MGEYSVTEPSLNTMASMAAMVGLAPTNAGPMRLFVYKYGALYQPAEIMSVTDTMTLDDVRREAARLLNLPVTKIDLVQLYVIVDHKYGRLTSIQQLCSNDNIVVSLRDEVGPADERTWAPACGCHAHCRL